MKNVSDPAPAAQEQTSRILVVEDNVLLRFALAEWLRLKGHLVLEAVSADEAIIILSSPVLIDLVITDIEMPGVFNGYDLAKHLRKIFPFLPIVMVSGKELGRHAEKNTDYEFFQKPYNFDEIAARVAQLLAQKKRKTGA